MKFITEGTDTEEIKQWMALYFSGNFQVLETSKIWLSGLRWFTINDITIQDTTMHNS